MKLISCHIENFGKLHAVDVSFSDGCNTILRENGSGKSTFASFILVMFYGFINERKKRITDNERRRFAPWQSGTYGGSVIFSAGGRRYRIERTFGAKDGKEDTFAVFDADTGLPTGALGEVPGETVFSIDRDSFERTAFVAQQDCGTRITPGIHAKIGNVQDDVSDMASYEAAQLALKQRMNDLTGARKTGAIHRLTDRIAVLEESVRNQQAEEAALTAVNREIRTLTAKRDALEKEQQEIGRQMEALGAAKDSEAKRMRAADLEKREQEALLAVQKQRRQFPGDVPELSEIDTCIGQASEAGRFAEKAESLRLTEEEDDRLSKLSAEFSGGVPEAADFEAAADDIRAMQRDRERTREKRLSPEETARLRELQENYGGAVPEDAETARMIRRWDARQRDGARLEAKRARLDALQQMIQTGNEPENVRQSGGGSVGRKFGGMVLALLGIALAAAGIFRFGALERQLAGLAALAAGAVLLLTGAVTAATAGKKGSAQNPSGRKDARIRQAAAECRALEAEIAAGEKEEARTGAVIGDFLARAGIETGEDGVAEALYQIRSEAAEYRTLLAKTRAYENTSAMEEKNGTAGRLAAFFQRYDPGYDSDGRSTEDFQEDLRQLRTDATDFAALSDRKNRCEEAERRSAAAAGSARNFLRRLGMEPEADCLAQLGRIRDDRQMLTHLAGAYNAARNEKERFERENEGAELSQELPADPSVSMESLNRSFEEKKRAIAALSRAIGDDRRQAEDREERLDGILEKSGELARDREEKKKLTHQYEVLSATSRFLEEAKIRFSARYMEPVRKAFEKYYQMLAPGDSRRYELDADLSIRVVENGASREISLLSCGSQDLIGLCRRMALVDVMYQNEKPFLVFDDPFVNLDDEKMRGAGRFMEALGREYQILYFTCSRSRT